MKTWYQIKAKANNPKAAEVSIHDEIGLWGVSASAFMRDLKALGPLDQINLSIHSPGGDVLDGWAIYNSLKNSKAHIVARVEGLAASMASVILMAADEVEIPQNAFVMIHNPWGLAVGDADEMRDTADLLDKLGNGLVNAYTERTGNTEEDIRAWMAAEKWMDGKEAVERGFADKLLDGVAMSAKAFDTRRFMMTPKSLQANSETEPEVAPVVEAPVVAPVDESPVDAVEEVEVEPPAPETEVTEQPQAKSLLQRFTALFGGETDETLKAELSAKRDDLAAARTEIDSLKAQVTQLEIKAKAFDDAEALIAKLEAERETAEVKAAAQIASAGFTHESEHVLPEAESDKGNFLDQFNALSGAEKSAFYAAHKDEILKADRA